MKKLFSLLLCAFFTALTFAASLPDGLNIDICGESLDTESGKNFYNACLKKGSIFYDVENRVLRLYNVYLISSNTNPTISISGSDKPVTIEFTGECTFYNSGTGNAWEFSTPVILSTQEGASVEAKSFDAAASALVLSADLTINNGAYIALVASDYCLKGQPLEGKYPTVTMDCSSLSMTPTGTGKSVEGVEDFVFTDCAIINSAITWSPEKRCAQKDGADYFGSFGIDRMTGFYFFRVTTADADGNLVDAGGKVTLQADGVEVKAPYKHKDAPLMTLMAEDTEDYTFSCFRDMKFNTTHTSATYTTTATNVADAKYHAEFTRKIKAYKPWYIFNENHLYADTFNIGKSKDLGAVYGLATDNFSTGACMMAGTNNVWLAYGTYKYSGTWQTSLDIRILPLNDVSTNTDLLHMIVFDYQTKYVPIYSMAYSKQSNCFFYLTQRKADSKYFLMRYEVGDTDWKEAVDLSSYLTNKPAAIAAGDNGFIYILEEDDKNAKLHTFCPFLFFGVTMYLYTDIHQTGVACSNSSKKNSIGLDPYTNELIWFQSDGTNHTLRVMDPASGYSHYAGENTMSACGMFQVHEYSTITLKAEDDDKGSATFNNGLSTGQYPRGSQVVAYVTPRPGRVFTQWEDGVTDNPRTITVGDDDATYTAQFGWEETTTPYPIWLEGRQFHSQRTTIYASESETITGGSASYDPATNTLTLIDLKTKSDKEALVVGMTDQTISPVTIKLQGTIELKTTKEDGSAIVLNNVDVTLANNRVDKTHTLEVEASAASAVAEISLNKANLAFETVTGTIGGKGHGISGTDNERVTIGGSTIKIDAGTKYAVKGIGELKLEACAIKDPATAAFNPATHQVEDADVPQSKITINPAGKEIRCTPMANSKGSFTLVSGDDNYTDKGWWEKDQVITITAVPADGFVFARWEDDTNWGDLAKQDDWLGPTREVTKLDKDEEYTALFYYEPKSTATWYGIHDEKFMAFRMDNHGTAIDTASAPSAANIVSGDYRNGNWEYLKLDGIYSMPFSGITNQEPIVNHENTEKIMLYVATLNDIAYDVVNGVTYGISNTNLYRIDYAEETLVDLGKLDILEGECIAIDAEGTIYILSTESQGATLWKVVGLDPIKLEPVGDNKGKTGAVASSTAQSMAFDLYTGELFWGGNDYLRVIDTETAMSYVVGDLGYKKSTQGVVRGLNRRTEKVTVRVSVADDSEGRGEATVNGKSSVSVLEGTKVMLKATEKEGYKFSYWTRGSSDTEYTDNPYTVTAGSSGNRYYAHFKKVKKDDDEAVDNVAADTPAAEKIIRHGQVLILRDGKTYNALGELIESDNK